VPRSELMAYVVTGDFVSRRAGRIFCSAAQRFSDVQVETGGLGGLKGIVGGGVGGGGRGETDGGRWIFSTGGIGFTGGGA